MSVRFAGDITAPEALPAPNPGQSKLFRSKHCGPGASGSKSSYDLTDVAFDAGDIPAEKRAIRREILVFKRVVRLGVTPPWDDGTTVDSAERQSAARALPIVTGRPSAKDIQAMLAKSSLVLSREIAPAASSVSPSHPTGASSMLPPKSSPSLLSWNQSTVCDAREHRAASLPPHLPPKLTRPTSSFTMSKPYLGPERRFQEEMKVASSARVADSEKASADAAYSQWLATPLTLTRARLASSQGVVVPAADVTPN